jgi:radical SAM superfamily enzyme YgiQ (UPF0313 family)
MKPNIDSRTIVLVQPPSTLQKLQRLKAKRPEMKAPLPFVYLAPYLLDAGFQVHVLDLRIDPVSTLERHLRELRPLIAGVSVMPGSMLRDTIEVTRRIKRASPATKTIWGGTFPTLHYGICLQVPSLDFVACGDGEWTLRELAAALADNDSASAWKGISGLAYVADGEVVTTAPREPVNLDAQPVGAWQILDRYIDHYLAPSRLLPINTARGCPYSCTFCYNTALYRGFNRYRTKSLEASMEEIRYLNRRYSPAALVFMDDDFLANRKRGMALLETAHRESPQLRYRIDARVNELADPVVVKELASYGLESAFFGVEAASEDLLDRIRKGSAVDETFAAARICDHFNIAGTYSFTCGYPGETLQDLYDRVTMAQMLGTIHRNSQSLLEIISPVIGTPLYAALDDKSLIPHYSIEQWSRFSDWKCADGKDWIANGQLYESFQLAFYLAFSSGSKLDGGVRRLTQLLSRWSRFRLRARQPRLLPEYRLANRLLKSAIWGGGSRRRGSASRRQIRATGAQLTRGKENHPLAWMRTQR